MKIKYDTGVLGIKAAEFRYVQLCCATYSSKLAFNWTMELEKGAWHMYVETPYDIFDTWTEMNDYITKLVVKHNKRY